MGAARQLIRAPWLSIGLAAGCIASVVIPSVGAFFIYDRSAVASGELWRILTAHFVHYTDSHLINNLIVLLPAMVLAEIGSRKDMVRVLVVSAAAIGVAVFALEPDVTRYAGASGVSLALVTYIALRGMAGNVRWRVVCGALLVLVGFKLAAENLFGWRWVNWEHESGIFTVTLAHSVGVVSGLLVWFVQTVKGKSGSFVARGRAGIDQSRQAS